NMSGQLGLDVGVESAAEISPCGRYRYWLRRRWSGGPLLGWVMLNPSTADDVEDDATIRRCIGFAHREKFGGIVVRNLFALRATDPRELLVADDPVGPRNTYHLSKCVGEPVTVAAWGVDRALKLAAPSLRTVRYAAGESLMCLGVTKDGSPKHPLHLRGDTPLEPWP